MQACKYQHIFAARTPPLPAPCTHTPQTIYSALLVLLNAFIHSRVVARCIEEPGQREPGNLTNASTVARQ